MTQEEKCKVLLVGDSVFDNVPYVDKGSDTVTLLKRELSSIATVESAAVDGYTTIEVLSQLIEGELKDKPKYDFIFLSIGGNDLLTHQAVYLDPSMAAESKNDFLSKVTQRFKAIDKTLKEMSDHVYWLGVYKPYFDPSIFSKDYIHLAEQAIYDVNNRLNMVVGPENLLSTSSIVNKPEDFTQVIEPSSVGSEKLAKELKRIICEAIDDL